MTLVFGGIFVAKFHALIVLCDFNFKSHIRRREPGMRVHRIGQSSLLSHGFELELVSINVNWYHIQV